MQSDDKLLEQCKSLIESKLGWGDSAQWTSNDFESLGDKILKETNVSLSLVTLKRIWGKLKYDSKPTTTTLNALAKYVGYENWVTFKSAVGGSNGTAGASKPDERRQRRSLAKPAFSLLGILVVLAAFYAFRSSILRKPPVGPGDYKFSSQVVSTGIPNSVIFEYDASAAAESDTVLIQQSWDPKLRTAVPANGRQYTCIYYYPGFFQAKLVVNGQVVKEHSLMIKTEGWLPLVETPATPVYFKEADALRKGEFGLTLETIALKNISLQPQAPWVDYYLVRDFGELPVSNFELTTELKNVFSEGSAICQFTEIYVLYEGNAIVIPLSIKGCVSDLKLGPVDPGRAELVNLGCDFSSWVTVRCSVTDGKGKVFVNNRRAFDFDLPATPHKIVGLVYRFQGSGSIKSVKLADVEGKVFYTTGF